MCIQLEKMKRPELIKHVKKRTLQMKQVQLGDYYIIHWFAKESGQSHPATPATLVKVKISQDISQKIVMKLLSGNYEDIGAGSFVCMEEHMTATHVMFHSASKSLLGKLKKLQDKIITNLQVVIITLMENVWFWQSPW